jgi:hypothetical protein
MSIANLKLDESTKLEFGVSITGTNDIPKTRFVIEGTNFSVSYPCKQTSEGVEVEISELRNVLPSGTYPVRLEVVIENKIYIPFKDSITFEPFVEIQTKPMAVNSVVKESIKIGQVTVKKQEETNTTHIAAIIAESIGYVPRIGETPRETIENALKFAPEKMKNNDALKNMLQIAESVGIF